MLKSGRRLGNPLSKSQISDWDFRLLIRLMLGVAKSEMVYFWQVVSHMHLLIADNLTLLPFDNKPIVSV